LEVDGDRPDPGNIRGHERDHERVKGAEDDMDEPAELPHVPVEVAQDEIARALAGEDLLVGREVVQPGPDPDHDGDVLV
jgi:hypothetical protein